MGVAKMPSNLFEIHSLAGLFRQALLAIGPLAEKAGVAWQREPPYDDWDVITDGIFDGFVRSAILNRGLETVNLARYGFEPKEGEAFLTTHNDLAFIRLSGADQMLSEVLFVNLQGRLYETRRWDNSNFALRLPDGNRISHIDVVS